MSPLILRAGSYVRQSKKRESGSEASPATQSAANRTRIDHMGAVFVREYADLGISAFSGAERPEFDRLLADCRSGRLNVIVVYYVSRFSRIDPLDAIPVVTELLALGVTIVSVTEGEFRKGNLMDLIHLIMRLDQAHGESQNKSVAVRGAKATARELGGYVSGKPPYGFELKAEVRRNSEGRPVQVQVLALRASEVPRVRDMVARALDPTTPATPHRIAAALNRERVPTRGETTGKHTAGSAWDRKTVERILRDPRIAGMAAEIVYGPDRADGRKSSSVAGYRIVRDADGDPVIAHPEIIRPATWFALQTMLDAHPGQVAPLGPAAPTLLSALGILFCECGASMKSHRNSARGFRSAYRCTRRAGVSRPGEHAGDCTVSMAALDDYIARRIFALIATADTGDDLDTLDTIAEATRLFGLASADPAAAAQRGAISGELDDAERSLNTLYEDRRAGGYAGPTGRRHFLDEERGLNARIAVLTERLAALDAMSTPTLPLEQWLAEPGEDPIGPGSWWAAAPLPERRSMVALFVRRITVAKAPEGATRPPIDSRVSLEWVRPGDPAAPDLDDD